MKLSNNELKVILSQLPTIKVDTFGQADSMSDYEFEISGYFVTFQVRVQTNATTHVEYYGDYGHVPDVHTEINSREVEFWEIIIYDEDDNMFIPLDKQEKIFEDIVRPKLDIV